MFPARFELRLHQHDDLSSAALVRRLRKGGINHGRKNQGRGDKGNIHREEIHSDADRFPRKIASVGFLQEPDSRILAKSEVHLAEPGPPRDAWGAPTREKKMGNPASGRANIKTNLSRDCDI